MVGTARSLEDPRSVPSSMTTWYDITRSRLLAPRLCITYSREAWRRDFSPQIRATDIFSAAKLEKFSSLFLLQREQSRDGRQRRGRACRRGWSSLLEGKRRGPSCSASSQRAHTHTRARRYAFPIFSSTAYHVIVETYAGERADMCSGPGVRREAEGYTVRCR